MSDYIESGLDTSDLLVNNAYLRETLDQFTSGYGDDDCGGYLPDFAVEQLTLTQENAYFVESLKWETASRQPLGKIIGSRFQPILNLAATSDAEIAQSLRTLIKALTDVNQHIVYADHLSDRDLYRLVVRDVLTALVPDITSGTPTYWYCCFFSKHDESKPSESIWLAYYATDAERAAWASDHVAQSLPPKKLPPYVRDYMPSSPCLSLT